MVARADHLRLEAQHAPAPRAPLVQLPAATRLQLAPLVALSGHLGLVVLHLLAPKRCSHSSWQPAGCRWRRGSHSAGTWGGVSGSIP